MTDLTEQWKKGELLEGWYWVKKKTCEEYIDKVYFWDDIFLDGDVPLDNNKVVEVLAPVPSYDELQSMNEAVNQAMAANIKLVEQNAQLKELLKECRRYIDIWGYTDTRDNALLPQIDEVLNA